MKNLRNYSDFIWNILLVETSSVKASKILQPGIFVFSSILMIGFGNVSYGQSNVKESHSNDSSKDVFVRKEKNSHERNDLWVNEPFGNYNVSKEIIAKRDANSKHFLNEDGSITAHVASGVINYNEGGIWKTIYRTIEPSKDGGFENVYNSFKSYYPKLSDQGLKTILPGGLELLELRDMRMFAQSNELESNEVKINSVNGSSSFNELIYSGAYGNHIDLKFTQGSTQRKMDYILKDELSLEGIPANATFLVFEEKIILPNNVIAELIGNKVILSNRESKLILAEYSNPVIYDMIPSENYDESYVSNSEALYEISLDDSELTIRTKVDLTWLRASNRNFPVVIDPTINIYSYDVFSYTTWRVEARGSSVATSLTGTNVGGSYNSAGTLAVGTRNLTSYTGTTNDWQSLNSLIRFDVTQIPDGSTVSAISLNTFTNLETGTDVGVRLTQGLTDPWSITTYGNRLTDIRAGNVYATTTEYNNGTGWKAIALNSLALNDMQNNLPLDWFSVGMWTYTATTAAQTINIHGDVQANVPYLTISYTEPDCNTSSLTPVTNADPTGITNVTFNTINNSTIGDPAYVDYNLSTTVTKGSTYTLTVRVNTDPASGMWTVRAKAWIDWDNNGVFSSTTEAYELGTAYNTADGITSTPVSILIPMSAATATVKMRVVAAEQSNYPHACGINFYGEGEDYKLVIQNAALPVELISFTAKCFENGEKNVQWITASEHNSSHFVLQRSTDGSNWENINTESAAGNSTTIQEYNYVDLDARGYDNVYYKLIQVDMDGQYKVYGPASAKCDNQSIEHRVYPNPSNGTFMLELNDANNSNIYNVQIKDGQGKIIYAKEYNTASGNGQYVIGLPEVAQGMYYLTISDKEAVTQTIKLVFR